MKIAVCMKQVPATSEGRMDKKTGVLQRTGLETVVNVYDLAALEAALKIKEQIGGEIYVFTMGPQKAEDVLREAFAMGADEGYLICGREFSGADVLATSYTLMQAIQTVGSFNLILCGRQTTDGDTAQVSGALAKWLGMAHLNWVTGIEPINGESLKVDYYMEERSVQAKICYPYLLAVEKDFFVPRMPSLKLKINGRKKPVHQLMIQDLEDCNPKHYGLLGSATRVKKIFPPERTKKNEVVVLKEERAAEYILEVLKEYIQEEQL